MATKRSGLGKGLSSLIPSEGQVGGGALRELDVEHIVPNQYQPRDYFDSEQLESLAASIAEVGVIQPIVVREASTGYELIAGERRWRAAKQAGLRVIPALVRNSDDMASLETAVVENLHRQDLNVLEEAAAYQQLIDDFQMTQADVATRVGRSRSAIANTLRLLQLPPSIHGLIVKGSLSAGHARALLVVEDPARQEALAKQIVRDDLSVRQAEALVKGNDESSTAPNVSSAPSSGGGVVDNAGALELEALLASRLDTRVRVQLGKGPGRLQIDFADLDDLERIYRIIASG